MEPIPFDEIDSSIVGVYYEYNLSYLIRALASILHHRAVQPQYDSASQHDLALASRILDHTSDILAHMGTIL